MTVSENRGRCLIPWAAMLALGAVMAATSGCGQRAPADLVVATSWPLAERVQLHSDFQKWVTSSGLDAGHAPIDLRWLILAPGDDVERLTGRDNPPDVLLGGRATAFGRLARDERLIMVEGSESARWCVARRTAVGPARFADPRTDTLALEWAMKQLGPGDWSEGYARLVQKAGSEPRIGWRRGEEWPVPAATDGSLAADWSRLEGVGILRSTRDPAPARAFLRFLIETRRSEPVPGRAVNDDASDPNVESLIADLLGSTLVDAQDELWTAWGSLELAGSPAPARKWLTEPPPWPPASIEKYLRREGENAMTLIETLAAELSPLPAARGWLIRSWLAPPRIVDAALLTEMAHAAEGALCREPRFRSWLRAEWTASARQRYRRVKRLAAQAQPGSVAK